jgi:enoyl-CoA hydratase/carnithine racemase
MRDTGHPPSYTVHGGVATVTLNRPQHRNRLQREDLHCLRAHIEAANRDTSVRVLVLAAQCLPEKPVFSAGFDLDGFGDHAGDAVDDFARTADALAGARPLTLAALGGSVYGGAADLAAACDFRVGVHGIELRVPAAALGLHYYPSGMRRLVATLGLPAVRRLLLAARPLASEELAQLGFFDELVAPDALDATVARWCAALAALAPLAVEGMKQTLREMAAGLDKAARWRARERLTHESRDFAEGVAALRTRRPARFVRA